MQLRLTGAIRTMPVVTKIGSGKPGSIFPDLVNSQIRSGESLGSHCGLLMTARTRHRPPRCPAGRRFKRLHKRPSPWTPGILAREVGSARSKLNGGRN